MRILIIGGTGAAGSRIATDAQRRGHEVTVAARTATPQGPGLEPEVVRLEASDVDAVVARAAQADVVIGATRPAVGREDDVTAVTRSLAVGTALAGVRLLVVGGAAPLRVPGTDRAALDDPRWVPPAIRSIAAASSRQLELLRTTDGVAPWTYLAPAADFAPGPSRGTYRSQLGHEGAVPDLVIADDGTSRISMEDFALAVCDEIEHPRMLRGVIALGW